MGGGTWTRSRFENYSSLRSASLGVAHYADATAEQVFTQRGVHSSLSPHGLVTREARDSAEHPESTPVIVGLDVTGSMSSILQAMATQDVNEMMTAIYDRKPITDPQIMCLGIGDLECDHGPLQVSQFESDIRISEQLEKVWLEGGGGGNSFEGYILAWYLAAFHTAIDSFDKRGKRGYLFTIGDEYPTPNLPLDRLGSMMGVELPADIRDVALANRGRIPAATLLEAAEEKWNVFHVVTLQGNAARRKPDTVDRWRAVLGQNVLPLRNHEDLARVIVSAIQISEGGDTDTIADSWGAAADVVREAVRGIRVR